MAEQQSLIFSFVAHGSVVLAQYSAFSQNFSTIALQCLQNLPPSNNKLTYTSDHHTFDYLVCDGFTYMVVASENIGIQLPFAYLERVKDDFKLRYGGGKAATDVAHSLDKDFGPRLKDHMQFCVDNPEVVSKLAKFKAQVEEVKSIMMGNIDKVIDRGEKVEVLVGKTENLVYQADDYRRHGKNLRWKMWRYNMRVKLVVLGIVILLILTIWLSVCRGFKCK